MIRHARPERIDSGPGPADPGLTAEGTEQAESLAGWWSTFGVGGLYVSPMARAQETAGPLARVTGLELTTVGDLREFDAHLDTYIPIEELRADETAWQAAVEAWMSPEAETQRQSFRATVVETIDAIAADNAAATHAVAVVCHGGVINAYLSHVMSLPGTMFFEPAYTSVSRIAHHGTHRQFVSANETPHLGRLVQPAVGALS